MKECGMAKEKICGIYKITNKINDKVYIGQSIDIYKRWRRHKVLGTSNNVSSPERKYPLYMAMRKYGIENFLFEILLICSPEELNEKEESYIRAYESDLSQYGYNCRKQFHSTGKLSEKDVDKICHMLSSTSLNMSEIADKMQVATTVISKINQGELHFDISRNYPIRTYKSFENKSSAQKHSKYCKKCKKPISAITKTGLCRSCYNNEIKAKQGLPEADINFNLIKRILDTSMEAVAREYGYTSGNAVKKLLRTHDLPTSRADMLAYYEEQTGHKHPSLLQKEEQVIRARQRKKKFALRRIAQYDQEGNLVAVYPSGTEATRQTDTPNSSIYRYCHSEQSNSKGFTWRYLDYNGNPIAPADLDTFQWHTVCDICVQDTGSFTTELCPHCAEHRQGIDRNNVTLEQLLELLHEYPIAQLAKLYSCSSDTILYWLTRFGVPEKDVRRLNRER